jgi:hypothetical protein
MDLVLEHGAFQAAALLAVHAVRAAATALLATCTGAIAAAEADPVATLWRQAPALRRARALQAGANVSALHDDLALYAYSVTESEARDLARDAHTFCAWALERGVAAHDSPAPHPRRRGRAVKHGPDGAVTKQARPAVSSGI